MNIGPVGDDLERLLLAAHMYLKEIRQAQITERLYNSYLDGLRESGCQLDPRRVRFGFAASAALRVGLFSIFLLSDELEQNHAPGEEAVQPPNPPESFEVSMANEAFKLLDSLSQ